MDLLWCAVPLEADGPDPGKLVPGAVQHRTDRRRIFTRSRSARAWERILESKERVSLEELAAELAGQKQAAAARRTLVLETKYGAKTYSLDELLHLYLTEGEHKTDILEHLKEEAL